MIIKTDLHTHSLVSSHAYSTITENCKYAAEIGMELIALTDHGPEMEDSAHSWHFQNIKSLPRVMFGVELLRGIETSILNENGDVNLTPDLTGFLDIIIASVHTPVWNPKSSEETTTALIALCDNPQIDILGHMGRVHAGFDIEKVVKHAAKTGTLMEINAHSFEMLSDDNTQCYKIAKACAENNCPVCVNSDAHFWDAIGKIDFALDLLKEIDFPEKLIMNKTKKQIKEYLNISL